MWIMTPTGFYSIVQKPWDIAGDTLTIRARVRSDLEALRHVLPELGAVLKDDQADYRYRAQAPRAAIARTLGQLIQDVHYDNFKHQVSQTQGAHRAKVYGKVWAELLELQGKET